MADPKEKLAEICVDTNISDDPLKQGVCKDAIIEPGAEPKKVVDDDAQLTEFLKEYYRGQFDPTKPDIGKDLLSWAILDYYLAKSFDDKTKGLNKLEKKYAKTEEFGDLTMLRTIVQKMSEGVSYQAEKWMKEFQDKDFDKIRYRLYESLRLLKAVRDIQTQKYKKHDYIANVRNIQILKNVSEALMQDVELLGPLWLEHIRQTKKGEPLIIPKGQFGGANVVDDASIESDVNSIYDFSMISSGGSAESDDEVVDDKVPRALIEKSSAPVFQKKSMERQSVVWGLDTPSIGLHSDVDFSDTGMEGGATKKTKKTAKKSTKKSTKKPAKKSPAKKSAGRKSPCAWLI
jgi:hypothetical protein